MARSTRDSIQDIWGARTPYRGEWPERIDEHVTEDPERWVQSCCVLCSNGCALDIGVKDGKMVGVRGRGADRVNRGRLGPKGLHGWAANHSPDRLTRPLIRRNGTLVPASWDEAMALIVERSQDIVQKHTGLGIGIYNTGQLFLEEYYTLAVLGRAGLSTPHMDGNTRLCTATAAAALMESFGCDGQPGSYTDLDVTGAVLLTGSNLAEQQTVLWMRILDRLEGPNPPKLVVIDPRVTPTAQKADVHLQLRVGTNLAVLNGLQHLLLEHGHVDRAYVEAHTVGFEELQRTVGVYTPELVERISGVPAAQLRAAADIIGTTPSLVSATLQGVYQSNQATASACQINNIHLLRGLIGTDGNAIYQMNGQPTAQNTRETGADGELTGFRNWLNAEHVREVAAHWNVKVNTIPHWARPTHALEMFRYAELGTIKMLWVICTNPAVSLPDLHRVRKILQKEDLFLVVQDAFLTETAALADVVLPAAIWGEKTGTFTNVDRTVHISHQAIDPPGEARSDFDIFLDYARRMEFRDQGGEPLIKWSDPEGAFNHFKALTRGRPCDYSGMTYAKLSQGSGIQWPCNDEHPDGAPHLYGDGVFPTHAAYCETYGHNLEVGAPVSEVEYKASDPQGKARLRAAAYKAPLEEPDAKYPLMLTTGRRVFHFHTRTKTGRVRALQGAAPDAWVQLSHRDAEQYGISDGDWVEIKSRRGTVIERAVVGHDEPGVVFIPFHYGYWDDPGRSRAANELTLYDWDPVSKQPHYKYAAVQIRKVSEAHVRRQKQPQPVGAAVGG